MRSTRGTAAVARLNQRCPDHTYAMASTGDGLFYLSERAEAGNTRICDPLPLEAFVKLVDSMGPQQVRRMTKNDIAFAQQLRGKKGSD